MYYFCTILRVRMCYARTRTLNNIIEEHNKKDTSNSYHEGYSSHLHKTEKHGKIKK